jgi:hypothetical protein
MKSLAPIPRRREILASALAVLSGLGGCGGGGSEEATAQTSVLGPASADGDDTAWPLIESEPADDTRQIQSASALQSPREAELAWLRLALSSALLPVSHLEVPSLENMRALKDNRGSFLGLRTYGGQPLVNGGVRAEVSTDFAFVEGETIHYSWMFAIPPDFQSDAPNNRWWVFAQWHGQPDPRLGQTWADFPSLSSPIGFGYGVLNGQDNLAFFYGAPQQSTVALIPFQRGRWNKIDLKVTWSRGAAGRAAVHLDGATRPVHVSQGPNMHNAYQHFLKLGSYRQRDIAGDAWIYIRNVQAQRG